MRDKAQFPAAYMLAVNLTDKGQFIVIFAESLI
jgi:hypothetical protein